jgi:hypothetical protein
MTIVVGVALVVQALALGAVALRLAWPVSAPDVGPSEVGGGVVEQSLDGEDDSGRVGFRR